MAKAIVADKPMRLTEFSIRPSTDPEGEFIDFTEYVLWGDFIRSLDDIETLKGEFILGLSKEEFKLKFSPNFGGDVQLYFSGENKDRVYKFELRGAEPCYTNVNGEGRDSVTLHCIRRD